MSKRTAPPATPPASAAGDRPVATVFTGVKTTGIYCRPGCPARTPKPENVVLFASTEEARRAGFRPCKRCRPDEAVADPHAAAVERACRRLEQDETEPSLADLAADAGLSPFHFQRVFKGRVGLSPKAYAKAVRTRRLAKSLESAESVTGAIYDAGFAAPSRAYEAADAGLGMTPSTWRKGGRGQTIRYAVARCYLGLLVVAGTERGICTIAFGDNRASLVEVLKERFPEATIRSAGADYAEWLDTVVRFLDRPSGSLTLPLDIQGTAFQRRVWEALQKIEPGTRVSYAELARRIGRPTAVRAVAHACAENKIAIAIPCHRVVRSDGHMAGYRWGTQRKEALLEREAEAAGVTSDE